VWRAALWINEYWPYYIMNIYIFMIIFISVNFIWNTVPTSMFTWPHRLVFFYNYSEQVYSSEVS
jgi:hypothetical protein